MTRYALLMIERHNILLKAIDFIFSH